MIIIIDVFYCFYKNDNDAILILKFNQKVQL